MLSSSRRNILNISKPENLEKHIGPLWILYIFFIFSILLYSIQQSVFQIYFFTSQKYFIIFLVVSDFQF